MGEVWDFVRRSALFFLRKAGPLLRTRCSSDRRFALAKGDARESAKGANTNLPTPPGVAFDLDSFGLAKLRFDALIGCNGSHRWHRNGVWLSPKRR